MHAWIEFYVGPHVIRIHKIGSGPILSCQPLLWIDQLKQTGCKDMGKWACPKGERAMSFEERYISKWLKENSKGERR